VPWKGIGLLRGVSTSDPSIRKNITNNGGERDICLIFLETPVPEYSLPRKRKVRRKARRTRTTSRVAPVEKETPSVAERNKGPINVMVGARGGENTPKGRVKRKRKGRRPGDTIPTGICFAKTNSARPAGSFPEMGKKTAGKRRRRARREAKKGGAATKKGVPKDSTGRSLFEPDEKDPLGPRETNINAKGGFERGTRHATTKDEKGSAPSLYVSLSSSQS